MLKKIFYFGFMFALLLSFACSEETKEKQKKSDEVITVNLADFQDKAPQLVGEKIKISGIVDHVCKHGGKKLVLVDTNTDSRVKVIANQTFDQSLVGNNVSVIGIVKENIIDEEYCEAQEQKLDTTDEDYEAKMAQLQKLRDSMKKAGVDKLVSYYIEFVDFANGKSCDK